jgi:hypothetical protein
VSDWFERRVARALHADVPLASDQRARRSVMEHVRRAAADGHPVRRGGDPWHRVSRSSIVGLTLAAGIGGISTLSLVVPDSRAGAPGLSTVVIGDTVVSTLRDTLRLVRLILDAPNARRVAVAGDFNRWDADVTPLGPRSPRRAFGSGNGRPSLLAAESGSGRQLIAGCTLRPVTLRRTSCHAPDTWPGHAPSPRVSRQVRSSPSGMSTSCEEGPLSRRSRWWSATS